MSAAVENSGGSVEFAPRSQRLEWLRVLRNAARTPGARSDCRRP